MKTFLLHVCLSLLAFTTASPAHDSHQSAPQSGPQTPPASGPASGAPSTRYRFQATGRTVEYDLEIAEQTVSPAGKKVRGLTINGTIPGPTLRFREGDTARIRVHNKLNREETSLHWHGLLVPNNQDGVPHLTTPPIPPGHSFTYEFPLRQSGTYWFHSHTGLQEQRGVLGSIVVEPRGGEPVHADREQVLVLTDWTNEDPGEILRTLKRGSNWYGIQKGSPQSMAGALKAGHFSDYISREKSRMPPMDLSDVAYDAFLINGMRRFHIPARPGETVRLRVVNGSSATYFYLQSAAGAMSIVAADGPPVEQLKVERLLIGIAETYDVLVKVPPDGSWEFRATAQDGSGSASAVLGVGAMHEAPAVPKPNLYDTDALLMAALEDAEASAASTSHPEMHGRSKKTPAGAAPGQTPASPAERPLPPYRGLRATAPTLLPPGLPRRTIELHLTGDMQRYIWSFNGKTIDAESQIPVREGEVLRLVLVNDTMMHHPIHLHGHFFRLLNGQGDLAPLKHTVDVPPMGRRTLEFETNEPGDWMFHCHVLYHMMEGMARVLTYEKPGLPADAATPHTRASGPHLGEHAMAMSYAFADFSVHSNLSAGVARLMSGRNSIVIPWEIGRKHPSDRPDYETDILYERYFSQNFGALAGARLSNMEPGGNRPVAGAWYRLPYMVTATGTVDGHGALRLALSKDFQLTARLGLSALGQYDTRQRFMETLNATYTLTKTLSLSAGYHSDYGLGAGLSFRF
jgi:FtsP/CotA-like multicopper oxidase with cupredoxin domain